MIQPLVKICILRVTLLYFFGPGRVFKFNQSSDGILEQSFGDLLHNELHEFIRQQFDMVVQQCIPCKLTHFSTLVFQFQSDVFQVKELASCYGFCKIYMLLCQQVFVSYSFCKDADGIAACDAIETNTADECTPILNEGYFNAYKSHFL